jgi:hypothetical protein
VTIEKYTDIFFILVDKTFMSLEIILILCILSYFVAERKSLTAKIFVSVLDVLMPTPGKIFQLVSNKNMVKICMCGQGDSETKVRTALVYYCIHSGLYTRTVHSVQRYWSTKYCRRGGVWRVWPRTRGVGTGQPPHMFEIMENIFALFLPAKFSYALCRSGRKSLLVPGNSWQNSEHSIPLLSFR